MRAHARISAVLAATLLLGAGSGAKSEEPSSIIPFFDFDNMFGLLNGFLSAPSTDVFCSTFLGASDLIDKSGGVLPNGYEERMVEVFNANSFYHCQVVQVEEEPQLRFLQSYKDAQGVTWHIFYTYSFGPISYTWRVANIPYA